MANQLKNSSFKTKIGRVADVSKIFPEIGAMVINELDGFLYIATRNGWGRGFDANEEKINLFFDFNGSDQFNLSWRMPAANSIDIDFGDGAGPQNIAGQDATPINTPSTYTTPGQYYITISGDIREFTWFRLLFMPDLYGDVTICEIMTNVEILTINEVSVTCDVSNFAALTAMTNFACQDAPNVYGDISGFNFTGPITLRNVGNLTMKGEGDFSNVTTFVGNDQNFTQREVDRIVRAMKNATTANVALDGNPIPSEVVKDDLLTGLANGNQYIFSARLPFFDLGPEQYTDANAVATGANEADALLNWSANGLGSPNVFETRKGVNDVRNSNFSIHANGNPNPTSGWDINTTLTLVDTELTQFSFNIRHGGVGGHTSLRMWGLSNMGWTCWPYYTKWRSPHIYVANRGASTVLEMGEISSTNNGEFFLDNLSIRKIS
jgi:hypothetical protein